MTPVGIEKTKSSKEIPKGEKSSTPNSWRIASYISFVVIVALILFHVQSRTSPSEVKAILEKSIAVLPFVNMSDDDEFAHFGDVITDEIIMQLYKINAFEVRSRTSIMQYKNTGKGSPAIGRELNVNYLLEGTAQRYQDQVRILVQLIHASSDDHIWGEIYEGEWKDIFNIQIKVAKQVAHELDPLSVEIWVEFGRRYYFVRDYDKAIEEYRKVLELFPNYGYYARSELALALSQKGLHNEAIEEYSKIEFEPTYHWHPGYIYGVAGKMEKLLEILNYYLVGRVFREPLLEILIPTFQDRGRIKDHI